MRYNTLLPYEALREAGIPYSKARLWQLRKAGKFPKTTRYCRSPRLMWKWCDIKAWSEKTGLFSNELREFEERRIAEDAARERRIEEQERQEKAKYFSVSWVHRHGWSGKDIPVTAECREGDLTELDRGHPVEVFTAVRACVLFSHVTDEDIYHAINYQRSVRDDGSWSRYPQYRRGKPIPVPKDWHLRDAWDAKTNWDDAPRSDCSDAMETLARRRGMVCQRCKSVAEYEYDFRFCPDDEGAWKPNRRCAHWNAGICPNCFIEIRADGWRRLELEKKFRELQRSLAEDRERREQEKRERAEAAARRRVLERAAYEFLAEKGLLEHLEQHA